VADWTALLAVQQGHRREPGRHLEDRMTTDALPPPDSNRSHAVQEILDALIPQMQPWTWMSEELVRSLEGAFEANRTHVLMHMLRHNMITPEQAQSVTPLQLYVAVFDLGFQAGLKLADVNQFRAMMGEDPV
jgi:hypothetical protein